MKIGEINNVAKTLGDYFISEGLTNDVGEFAALYTDSSPITSVPESFLRIVGNGPLSTRLSQNGILEYTLSVIINVRLLPNGNNNSIRETYLTSLITDRLENGIDINEYHYRINKRSLVYSGRSVYSGYSTKVININVKIY